MAESKIRDDNFFMVSGWMLNRLNLKGAALQIFAIIYGFSQDGEGSFTGSLQYLMDFTNSSKNTVLKALRELTERGFVTKIENTINGVRFCTYKTNAPVVQKLNRGSSEIEPRGGSETAPGGGSETEHNNKSLDNKSIISKKIEEVIDLYHSVCVSYPKIRALSKARQKAIERLAEQYSLEDIKLAFENAENSSFMKGKNDRGWNATFDWMIGETNFCKVLEGNYADKGRKEVVPGWMQREPDDEEIRAIQKMMQEDVPDTLGNNPELAARAARLQEMLQGE